MIDSEIKMSPFPVPKVFEHKDRSWFLTGFCHDTGIAHYRSTVEEKKKVGAVIYVTLFTRYYLERVWDNGWKTIKDNKACEQVRFGHDYTDWRTYEDN